MTKIEENDKVIPWLLNSNLRKVKVIKSHIGPKTLKLNIAKFKKITLNKSNALDSRARQEVEAYCNVPNATEYQIYIRLTKICKKLKKICKRLELTVKKVRKLYCMKLHLRPRMVRKLVIKNWKTVSTKKSIEAREAVAEKRENNIVKLDIVVFEMLCYMKKFRLDVKGKAKELHKPTYSRSVFLRMDLVDRNSDESRLAIKVATKRELKTAIGMLGLPPSEYYNEMTPIMIDDTLDQKSAAKLVDQALAADFPAERLIIPEVARVRVTAKGFVEMY